MILFISPTSYLVHNNIVRPMSNKRTKRRRFNKGIEYILKFDLNLNLLKLQIENKLTDNKGVNDVDNFDVYKSDVGSNDPNVT